MNHLPSGSIFFILVPLLAWRVYARVRRNVGRQRLRPTRPWITVVVFPLLMLMLTAGTVWYPPALGALWGGAVAGGLLAMYGLRRTRFENTPQGRFFTPDARIGIALSVLFIGRIAYRAFAYYAGNGDSFMTFGPTSQSSQFAHSPLTLALFGMLAGYYITYAVGLLRWMNRAV